MAIGNPEPIAPTSIVVPYKANQTISGALFISGGHLYVVDQIALQCDN